MTRKHFEEIARQINEHRMAGEPEVGAILDMLSKQLSYSFAHFNPRFNRTRFLDACGVTDSPVGWASGEARRAARMAYERAEEAKDAEAIARYNARKVSK